MKAVALLAAVAMLLVPVMVRAEVRVNVRTNKNVGKIVRVKWVQNGNTEERKTDRSGTLLFPYTCKSGVRIAVVVDSVKGNIRPDSEQPCSSTVDFTIHQG